jgi:AcrR family transcriptional regulator
MPIDSRTVAMPPSSAARLPRSTRHEMSPPKGRDDGRERLVQVASAAFAELGFDAVTMEEIAKRANTSRATLYRRYATREELFIAVLLARAAEYFDATRTRSASGGLSQELADSTVLGVIEMPADPVLRALYEQGTRGLELVMTNPGFRAAVADAVWPLLTRWRRRGELRQDLDFDDVLDWMVHEQFTLIARGPWTEAALRRYVETFMTPVLLAPQARADDDIARADDVLGRLARVEQKLDQIAASVPPSWDS